MSSGFTHRRQVTVEWGHCDPAGIVFNPRFFEYFDASTALLVAAALGIHQGDLAAIYGIVGIPLVDTRARFLAPARFGDVVDIRSTIASVGRTSFTVTHTLSRGEQLCVEGQEVRVWAGRRADDPGRLAAKPLPAEVASKFGAREG